VVGNEHTSTADRRRCQTRTCWAAAGRSARAHVRTVGIDIDPTRIAELERYHDGTNEINADSLAQTSLTLTSDPTAVTPADIYIVTVPTPVDADKKPDLSILESASRIIGMMLDAARKPIICF
jgi:UDP-N-acetyl-D-galactosamine dehydrogenase